VHWPWEIFICIQPNCTSHHFQLINAKSNFITNLKTSSKIKIQSSSLPMTIVLGHKQLACRADRHKPDNKTKIAAASSPDTSKFMALLGSIKSMCWLTELSLHGRCPSTKSTAATMAKARSVTLRNFFLQPNKPDIWVFCAHKDLPIHFRLE